MSALDSTHVTVLDNTFDNIALKVDQDRRIVEDVVDRNRDLLTRILSAYSSPHKIIETNSGTFFIDLANNEVSLDFGNGDGMVNILQYGISDDILKQFEDVISKDKDNVVGDQSTVSPKISSRRRALPNPPVDTQSTVAKRSHKRKKLPQTPALSVDGVRPNNDTRPVNESSMNPVGKMITTNV